MKKIIIIFCLIAPMAIMAQNNAKLDSLNRVIQNLKKEILSSNNKSNSNDNNHPRYKMYQTENQYNLLKLDTRTGEVSQVQYRMKDVEPMVIGINYFGIVFESDSWNGRFELYPTKNHYTFIMLDTGTGNTYQVQWGTSSEYRFVEKIE